MENKDLTTVITNKREKVNVIDSREVAEMMGRTHTDIMKMIQGSGKNLGIIPTLTKGNFHVVDYLLNFHIFSSLTFLSPPYQLL